ncbi:2Fe-2S iron-sulfur cluster binding domain protein [Paraburkholderia xenovorans LB400]|uniref:Phthalate 4,5-dioxygenase reductase subunit (OhpA1) n=1 Tax=Paraburkholderia xenovorans (strain LB400) TaxID=266265 RepID=Q13QL9_PARXL|nr:PDR/VanB family oxidoreductase [Paraburkholderia xenovorans]ABE33620.1 Putative phthalate 4,5-dioxygenase reductase subunit (OhpA1) [Paraburkholderia xenovorans LB400]AIP37509.1 2Fe-2S iron-sulfur cluster binding domain protein [Paraburkholderia xenovorans LB400]
MSQHNADRIDVRLTQIRLEADDVASYEFRPIGTPVLPAFEAGAHIDLYLPENRVRSYSLVNAPHERHRYVIAVQREAAGRGGSAWMHRTPRVGDRFTIGAPMNDFPLCEAARQSVFICGGIGITPIVSMIRRLERTGASWQLHYAARERSRAAYADDLAQIDEAGSRITMHLESEGGRLDLRRVVERAPADAHLYCCGPRGMVDAFIEACASRPRAQVHFERFAAANESATAGGFDVVLGRDGRRIPVAPGKTILDTLLDHGVDVQYACSAGVCGTCRTGVIDGVPDHRDDYLTDEEKAGNRAVMVCCSGSLSPTLVLDL